jgi:hypothetical protein
MVPISSHDQTAPASTRSTSALNPRVASAQAVFASASVVGDLVGSVVRMDTGSAETVTDGVAVSNVGAVGIGVAGGLTPPHAATPTINAMHARMRREE